MRALVWTKLHIKAACVFPVSILPDSRSLLCSNYSISSVSVHTDLRFSTYVLLIFYLFSVLFEYASLL